GEQLIEQLKNDATRSSAYFELARRAGDLKEKSEAEFAEHHRSPELVVCPQGEGQPPIYVLLSDFLGRDRGRNGFDGADDKIFKAAAPGTRRKKKLIEAFTAAGKRIKPFGGANVVEDGLFADINGDGRVLKADGEG